MAFGNGGKSELYLQKDSALLTQCSFFMLKNGSRQFLSRAIAEVRAETLQTEMFEHPIYRASFAGTQK
jgi:hypothetical protein